jgi:hypothetical protein
VSPDLHCVYEAPSDRFSTRKCSEGMFQMNIAFLKVLIQSISRK